MGRSRPGQVLAVVAILLALGTPARVGAGNSAGQNAGAVSAKSYALDAGASKIYVMAYKGGAASTVAHDHAIAATRMSGTLQMDLGDVTQTRVRVAVPVHGLVPDPDALRAWVGLPDTLSESQRKEIKRHMLAAGQLSGDAFKEISFESRAVTGSPESLSVAGTITVRGVERPIRVRLEMTRTDKTLRFKGQFALIQSEFGYEPYSALLGTLKVKDKVDVHLDLVFHE